MKVNLYLPDEIGQRAKAAEPELNLSRLLRDAVEEELRRREHVAAMLVDVEKHELRLHNEQGAPYTGVLTGKLIAYNENNATSVFLTSDERLMVHDEFEETVEQIDNPDEIRTWLKDDELYISVCAALGKPARVEL